MAPLDVSSANQADLLSGSNATFIAELFELYSENPSSVDPSWALDDLVFPKREDGSISVWPLSSWRGLD